MKWYIRKFATLLFFTNALVASNSEASPAYEIAQLQLSLAESAYLLEQNSQTLSRLIASRETILTLICPLRDRGGEDELSGRCQQELGKILEHDPENPVALCVRAGSRSRSCAEAYKGREIEIDRSILSTSDDSRLSDLRQQAIDLKLELRENPTDKSIGRKLFDTYSEALHLACPNVRNEVNISVENVEEVEEEENIPVDNFARTDTSPEEGPLSQLSSFLSGESRDAKSSSLPSRVRRIPRICMQLITESNTLSVPISAGPCIRFGPFSPECYDAVQREREYFSNGEPDSFTSPSPSRRGTGRF